MTILVTIAVLGVGSLGSAGDSQKVPNSGGFGEFPKPLSQALNGISSSSEGARKGVNEGVSRATNAVTATVNNSVKAAMDKSKK